MVPTIDREMRFGGRVTVRRRSSRLSILTVLLAVAVISGALAGLMVRVMSSGRDWRSEAPTVLPAESLYNPSNPITISGNAAFTAANGVVGGTGTLSDPYIIANWNISASFVAGISISGTDAHFIVRDCLVGGFGFSNAISLSGCANGTLENNTCIGYADGIFLTSSSHNTLINNTCVSNSNWGINLYSSNNNSLINNTCGFNSFDGIYLYSSSDNVLRANNCNLNSGDGIWLDLSNDNTLIGNNLIGNSWDGITVALSSSGNVIFLNQVGYNSGYGMIVVSGSDNFIWNNTFAGNNGAYNTTYDPLHVQASDNGTDDRWNSTAGYGNYWSDWTTPDIAPPFGIVDVPYNISGTAGAKDYYPQTTIQQIPEFGMMPFVVVAFMGVVILAGERERRNMS